MNVTIGRGATFQSTGTLKYSTTTNGYKLVVDVDSEISRYYRFLIPKAYRPQPQMYAPHVSVVRKEIPQNLDRWGKYDNQEVEIFYET